jgi:hypothetical protein
MIRESVPAPPTVTYPLGELPMAQSPHRRARMPRAITEEREEHTVPASPTEAKRRPQTRLRAPIDSMLIPEPGGGPGPCADTPSETEETCAQPRGRRARGRSSTRPPADSDNREQVVTSLESTTHDLPGGRSSTMRAQTARFITLTRTTHSKSDEVTRTHATLVVQAPTTAPAQPQVSTPPPA